MSSGARVAKSVGYLALAKGGTMALNFATWAYLARVLEPEPYGQLGVGLALVGYFVLGVTLGFDAIGMREIARRPERVSRLVSDLVALRLLLCIVAVAAYLALVWALPRPLAYKGVLTLLGLQLVARAVQLDWVFIATERTAVVAGRELAASVLMLLGTLLVVRQPSDVAWAAVLVVGAPLLSSAGMWVSYRRVFGRLQLRMDRGAWLVLLRPALPLAASAFMIEVYTSLDRLMIEGYRTTAEAGLYFAAYKVLSLAIVPAAVLNPAFFASLAAALGDRQAMRERGRAYARALLAFGVPIALAGPFLAEDVVVLINGPEYASAGLALAVLLVNAGVIHLNTALGTPLMAWDLQTPYMWTVVAGGVANVILNVILIPTYGMAGAACATVLSEGAVGLGLVVVYRRATGDVPLGPLRRTVPAALLGAVAPAALGTWAAWPVLLTAVLSAVGYGVAAWTLGVVDRDWVRSVLRQRFARGTQPHP